MKKLIILITVMFVSTVYSESYQEFQRRALHSNISIGGGYSIADYRAWFVTAATINKRFGVGMLVGRYNLECPTFNPYIRGNVPSTLKPVYCPNGIYIGLPIYYRPYYEFAIGATVLLKLHEGITVQFNQEVGRFQETHIDNSVYLQPYLSASYIQSIMGAELGVLPLEPMATFLIHLYM